MNAEWRHSTAMPSRNKQTTRNWQNYNHVVHEPHCGLSIPEGQMCLLLAVCPVWCGCVIQVLCSVNDNRHAPVWVCTPS